MNTETENLIIPIHAYPVLVEGNGQRVAQAEHTFIPNENGVTITTLGL